MSQISLFFLFFLALNVSQAGTFTVKKLKGNQALITLQGEDVQVGRTYGFTSAGSDAFQASRNNFLSITAMTFSSLNQSISGATSSTTRLNILGSYGWNKGTWEYGPILGFGSSAASSSTSTSFTLGGRADYNFNPNTLSLNYLLGSGFQITSERATSSSSSIAQTENVLALSIFWKWFVFSPTTCLRMDLGYQYGKYSGNTELTESGFVVSGGFGVYF